MTEKTLPAARAAALMRSDRHRQVHVAPVAGAEVSTIPALGGPRGPRCPGPWGLNAQQAEHGGALRPLAASLRVGRS